MKKTIEIDFNLPDWAKYHATDENGDFCIFEEKPFLLDEIVGEGIFETKSNFMLLAKNCTHSNWKDSLAIIE
tara:strand:- start:599 stop:814 length:216 start_codon:yes stop_codon:yes gene_type:complete